jgi:hypothetical protein
MDLCKAVRIPDAPSPPVSMRAVTAIPMVALAAAAAACGGGASKHYDASEVHGCLVDKHLSVTSAELPGDVSADGTEGDLYVKVGANDVSLAFGKDSSEAAGHAEDERAAARAALDADAGDYVRTKGNVAYWVTGTDTSAFDPVEGCLK